MPSRRVAPVRAPATGRKARERARRRADVLRAARRLYARKGYQQDGHGGDRAGLELAVGHALPAVPVEGGDPPEPARGANGRSGRARARGRRRGRRRPRPAAAASWSTHLAFARENADILRLYLSGWIGYDTRTRQRFGDRIDARYERYVAVLTAVFKRGVDSGALAPRPPRRLAVTLAGADPRGDPARAAGAPHSTSRPRGMRSSTCCSTGCCPAARPRGPAMSVDPELDALPRPPARLRWTPKRIAYFALIVSVVVVGAIYGVAPGGAISGRHVSTDDAFITGRIAPVSARVSGHVAKVLVTDNQDVKAGDVLVQPRHAGLRGRPGGGPRSRGEPRAPTCATPRSTCRSTDDTTRSAATQAAAALAAVEQGAEMSATRSRAAPERASARSRPPSRPPTRSVRAAAADFERARLDRDRLVELFRRAARRAPGPRSRRVRAPERAGGTLDAHAGRLGQAQRRGAAGRRRGREPDAPPSPSPAGASTESRATLASAVEPAPAGRRAPDAGRRRARPPRPGARQSARRPS